MVKDNAQGFFNGGHHWLPVCTKWSFLAASSLVGDYIITSKLIKGWVLRIQPFFIFITRSRLWGNVLFEALLRLVFQTLSQFCKHPNGLTFCLRFRGMKIPKFLSSYFYQINLTTQETVWYISENYEPIPIVLLVLLFKEFG